MYQFYHQRLHYCLRSHALVLPRLSDFQHDLSAGCVHQRAVILSWYTYVYYPPIYTQNLPWIYNNILHKPSPSHPIRRNSNPSIQLRVSSRQLVKLLSFLDTFQVLFPKFFFTSLVISLGMPNIGHTNRLSHSGSNKRGCLYSMPSASKYKWSFNPRRICALSHFRDQFA